MKKRGRPPLVQKKDKMLVLKINEGDRASMHDFVDKYNATYNQKLSLSAMMLKIFNGFMKRHKTKMKSVENNSTSEDTSNKD